MIGIPVGRNEHSSAMLLSDSIGAPGHELVALCPVLIALLQAGSLLYCRLAALTKINFTTHPRFSPFLDKE
jgi:hypothetical protein